MRCSKCLFSSLIYTFVCMFPLVASAQSIEVQPHSVAGCFLDTEPLVFTLQAKEGGLDKSPITCEVQTQDGKAVDVSLDPIVLSNAKQSVEVKVPTLPHGGYRLVLKQQDKDIAQRDWIVMSPVPALAKDVNRERFGVCTHLQDYAPNGKDFQTELEVLKRTGLQWVRLNINWARFHAKPGEHFSQGPYQAHFKRIKQLEDAGIQWVESIQAAPAWAAKDRPSWAWRAFMYPPQDWEQWRIFVNHHFNQLKNRTSMFEIWNEPLAFMSADGIEHRLPGGVLQAVGQMGDIAYKQAQQIIPDTPILGPSPASACRYEMTDVVLREHGKIYDTLSIHYPRFPLSARSNAVELSRIAQQRVGEPLPVICTEDTSLAAVDDRQLLSGDRLVRYHMRLWAEGIVDRSFSWVWRYKQFQNTKANSSLFLDANFQPRPGIVILQTMIIRLRDAEFAAWHENRDGLEWIEYVQHDKRCAVVWSTDDHKRKLPADWQSANTQAFDMFNNPIDIAQMEIGDEPVYLVDLPAADSASVIAQIRPYRFRLDTGMNWQTKINLTNLSDSPQQVQVQLDDAAITFEPATFNVKLQARQSLAFPIGMRIKTSPQMGQDQAMHVHAHVNGIKQVIAQVEPYDQQQIKTMTVADFSSASQRLVPQKQTMADSLAKNHSFEIVTDPTGSGKQVGQLDFHWQTKGKPIWYVGNFNLAKPAKLAGIPTQIRIHYRATPDQCPNLLWAGIRVLDAKGRRYQFGMAPHQIVPSDKPGYQVIQTPLESPVTEKSPHSQQGGGTDGVIVYPLRFEGIFVSLAPRRDTAEFQSRVWIEKIEADYYQPAMPVKQVYTKHSRDYAGEVIVK